MAFQDHANPVQQTQASTSALITLLVSASWVLAVVSRPYSWWRVALVAGSVLAYVAIFSIPLAREQFMLDPSNVALTSKALVLGFLGAVAIEVTWWVQGRVLGERRRLWRPRHWTRMAADNRPTKGARVSFLDKVKGLLSKNADKVDTAIDKAGDVVDAKTQGKYKGAVDKVQDAAKNAVDKPVEAAGETPARKSDDAGPPPPAVSPAPPTPTPPPADPQP